MKYRTLPGTALRVSEVCLGSMTWGEQNDEAEAHAQLDYAVARGVNFIDTAEMYPAPPNATTQGRTETYLGRWLARRAREGLVIASKVAGPGRRDWIRNGRTDLTREVIAEAVDTSLARLQIDCIDLYQIHWPQRNVPMFGATQFDPAKEHQGPSVREQVEGMAAMIDAGKIRHYGLSNETAWGVCEFGRVARARSAGTGNPPEQLQPDLAQCRQRSGRSPVPRTDVLARLQPPGRRHAVGKISGGRQTGPVTLCAVR
jgi:aryl-alcohol dehydrogenase-like predicted oxidoreductase